MAWLALAAILVSAAFLVSERTPWLRTGDQASTWLLRQLAAVRTPGLTSLAGWINATGVTWHPAIGVAVVLLVIVFRRWRHLLVFTLCLLFLEIAAGLIYDGLSRPRPYGVPIIGKWDGYSAPSLVVLAVTFFLVAAVYCAAGRGRWRRPWWRGWSPSSACPGSTWPSIIRTTCYPASSWAWPYRSRRSVTSPRT